MTQLMNIIHTHCSVYCRTHALSRSTNTTCGNLLCPSPLLKSLSPQLPTNKKLTQLTLLTAPPSEAVVRTNYLLAGCTYSYLLPHISFEAESNSIESFLKGSKPQIIGNIIKMKCAVTCEKIMLLSDVIEEELFD